MNRRRGFSLIELLVVLMVVAIIAIGTAISLRGQVERARNEQRSNHLQTIMAAVRQNIADHRGLFSCGGGDVPTSSKRMAIGDGNYDIAPCLLPSYLSSLPVDPATSTAHFISLTDYDTAYYIIKDASLGTITLSAPAAELGEVISVSR